MMSGLNIFHGYRLLKICVALAMRPLSSTSPSSHSSPIASKSFRSLSQMVGWLRLSPATSGWQVNCDLQQHVFGLVWIKKVSFDITQYPFFGMLKAVYTLLPGRPVQSNTMSSMSTNWKTHTKGTFCSTSKEQVPIPYNPGRGRRKLRRWDQWWEMKQNHYHNIEKQANTTQDMQRNSMCQAIAVTGVESPFAFTSK